MPFRNRTDAGHQLAIALLERHPELRDDPDVVVLGLARGGFPVAMEIARWLGVRADVWITRKVGVPREEELAAGAVSEEGSIYWNAEILSSLRIPRASLEPWIRRARDEIRRRVSLYRPDRPHLPLKDRTVIVADDGLATGATMKASLMDLSRSEAARILVALPVGARDSVLDIERMPKIEDVVCLERPEPFGSVGSWYDEFGQVDDAELEHALLHAGCLSHLVLSDGNRLLAHLSHQPDDGGLVVFLHGQGSGALSPRNSAVARRLHSHRLSTLRFSLLTDAEKNADPDLFDEPLLLERAAKVVDWIGRQDELRGLPVLLFGGSTGAALALRTAVSFPRRIAGVISRGGRVDLARESWGKVPCAVLLVVGSRDSEVLRLNEQALERIPHARLRIIEGASHLFAETGALEELADTVVEWVREENLLATFTAASERRGRRRPAA